MKACLGCAPANSEAVPAAADADSSSAAKPKKEKKSGKGQKGDKPQKGVPSSGEDQLRELRLKKVSVPDGASNLLVSSLGGQNELLHF